MVPDRRYYNQITRLKYEYWTRSKSFETQPRSAELLAGCREQICFKRLWACSIFVIEPSVRFRLSNFLDFGFEVPLRTLEHLPGVPSAGSLALLPSIPCRPFFARKPPVPCWSQPSLRRRLTWFFAAHGEFAVIQKARSPLPHFFSGPLSPLKHVQPTWILILGRLNDENSLWMKRYYECWHAKWTLHSLKVSLNDTKFLDPVDHFEPLLHSWFRIWPSVTACSRHGPRTGSRWRQRQIPEGWMKITACEPTMKFELEKQAARNSRYIKRTSSKGSFVPASIPGRTRKSKITGDWMNHSRRFARQSERIRKHTWVAETREPWTVSSNVSSATNGQIRD